MTNEPFSYDDYERVRSELVETINQSLTDDDKHFLLSFIKLLPDWNLYPFSAFPGVQWKLLNLGKLRDNNPMKHTQLLDKLMYVLKTKS